MDHVDFLLDCAAGILIVLGLLRKRRARGDDKATTLNLHS